jgi:hypothetical protein
MNLWLDAKSKNNIGYTPDWIQVTYMDNKKSYELTFDIRGEIAYKDDTLSCRCKGNIYPWTFWDIETGKETDLTQLSENELKVWETKENIIEIFKSGTEFIIGIYPVEHDDVTFKNAENDIVSEGKGKIQIDEFELDFEFTTELNYE